MLNDPPKLFVDVADTPYKQAQGLMFINKLPENEGMLFDFARQKILSFWGENTYIPLDIAFADTEGTIHEITNIKPLTRKPVRSSVPCRYAIEANTGYFRENRIDIGDKIVIEEDPVRGKYVCFAKKRRNEKSGEGKAKRTQVSQLLSSDPSGQLGDAYQPQADEEQARSQYESLPKLTPQDIGMALEDNLEEPPLEVQPPSEAPPPDMPVELPEIPDSPIDEVPDFENAFDATEWSKPTAQNQFTGHLMRISYTTKSGKNIIRDVEPHGTFHAETTGNEIMVTFDRTVGDIRAFIISNITAYAVADEEFEPKFRV